MKLLIWIIFVLIFLCPAVLSYGERRSVIGDGDVTQLDSLEMARRDSVAMALSATNDSVKNNPFNLPDKPRKKFMRTVLRAMTVRKKDRDAEELAAQEETEYYNRFAGRTINEVQIFRKNVFEGSRLWIDRVGNSLHVITGESVIKKDLLFNEGDKLDPDLFIRNKQLIKSRSYISDVQLLAIPLASDTTIVDIYVVTRDSWSISADARLPGNGKSYFEIYDDNLLGFGHSLEIRTYLSWKTFKYGGNWFRYTVPNILGTFFDARVVAGKGFDNQDYGVELNKDFIRTNDFAGGATVMYAKMPIDLFPLDSFAPSRYTYYEAWGGKSFYLPRWRSSFYLTAAYSSMNFLERPEVRADYNPYFHNYQMVLGSIGLYRENFRRSLLIYGYGVEEYIAYGYRLGLVGGYRWDEFGRRSYIGGDFSAGHFMGIGYLQWSFQIGTFLNKEDGKFYQSALRSHINYFSNLWGNGSYRVRQFVNLNATRGWNRLSGYRELIGFRYNGDLRGLSEKAHGENSLVLNNETVVFTPWNLLNFRVALYGYTDIGLIGNNGNFFKNDFYATVGVGIRIKNERLIFKTIDINFMFALNKHGFAESYYAGARSIDRRSDIRYRPEKPMVFEYR